MKKKNQRVTHKNIWMLLFKSKIDFIARNPPTKPTILGLVQRRLVQRFQKHRSNYDCPRIGSEKITLSSDSRNHEACIAEPR